MSDASDALAAELIAEIAKVERIPVETITLDSRFEELGIDSLDGFSLLYELEQKFDVTISDEDARAIGDVRSLLAVLEHRLAERQGPNAGAEPA